ncbi:MAG: hypothetical protein AAF564_22645 [Bacteroidota bacterium]
MGKGALVIAIAVVFSTLLAVFNMQGQANETESRENKKRSLEVARDLAMTGRKLVLTHWVDSEGSSSISQPFTDTLTRDGGKIWIEDFSFPSANILEFRAYGAYDSTVHEIRSRFSWQGFALNPVQFKVGALQPSISQLSVLDLESIALDDQSLQDLEDVFVDDLEQINDLSEWGLGLTETSAALENALINGNKSALASQLQSFTQAERDAFDGQAGLFYPDQISEAVEVYALSNPSEHQVASSAGDLSSTFGLDGSQSMLTVEGDLTLSSDFSGKGILVVEGDLIVPPGVTFNWDGVILVKPPQNSLNPAINLGGDVTIEGAIVALHEGLPNTGHMDVSVYRDMSGIWSSAFGQDFHHSEILQHTHDFTSKKGNRVVFHSDDAGEPNHEGNTYFNETMSLISDSIFFEIVNQHNHGRGVIMIDRTTDVPVLQTAGGGFDPSIAVPGNEYRTEAMPIGELEHFDISITRLSSLKKMWDTGEDYDPCYHPIGKTSGPDCVWADFNRYGSLGLRAYKRNRAIGPDKMVYEASLYWHRRTDEEEDFEDEMDDLASDLQSSDYGLDLIIGDNTIIRGDKSALLSLGAFSGLAANFGVTNLGTWHRQWEARDANNPLYVTVVTQ